MTSQQAPMTNPNQTFYMGSQYVKVWRAKIVARKKIANPKSLLDWQSVACKNQIGTSKLFELTRGPKNLTICERLNWAEASWMNGDL